jgi:crossover junction endodeoxyribonuclease RusA
MLAATKAGLDGIADVIGVDDHRWAISLRRGDPVKGGAVVVEIETGAAG